VRAQVRVATLPDKPRDTVSVRLAERGLRHATTGRVLSGRNDTIEGAGSANSSPCGSSKLQNEIYLSPSVFCALFRCRNVGDQCYNE
jgi:hypothetical protein